MIIVANKQDLPDCYSTNEIAEIFELYHNFKHIKWYIRGTSCVSGEGVNECMDWVIENCNHKQNEEIISNRSKKIK